jgi:hypothetical protein
VPGSPIEALKRLNHKSPLEVNTNGVRYQHAIARRGKRWVEERDPVKYILSKNVHRRHLTAEQRRDAIATFVKADPRASSREVARALKVDDKTVASVRAEPVSNAEIPQMEHLPIQRAKVAVRANPTASVGAVMRLAKVGRATVVRARKLVAAEPSETVVSEASSSAISPAAIDAEQETKKKAEQFRASVRKMFASWTEQWLKEIGFDAMKTIIQDEAQAWLWTTTTVASS